MYSARFSSPYYSSTYQYQTLPQQPQCYTYDASPKGSKHRRRATTDGTYAQYCYYTTAEETKPKRSSSHRHREHVSSSDCHRSQPKRTSYGYTTDASGQYQYRSGDAYYSYPQQQSAYYARPGGHAGSREEYTSAYERKYRTSPPPFTRQSFSYPGAYADGYAYRTQNTAYAEHAAEPKTRARRSSFHATKPTAYYTQQTYTQQPAEPVHGVRQATDADARRAGIPAGFSLKHWDPSEDPILLLGSVFDANSLGKWIYDWTVACHGASAPLTEVAADLWLLLIQLAGKIKRAEARIGRVRSKSDRAMIEDFLESGERLWAKFSKLLKVSESYMLKVAKKKSSSSKKVVVGKDSGVQFIKCIFGRDHELERTEKFMTGIKYWSQRFDANCDDILRRA